jgi:hypothetical protein
MSYCSSSKEIYDAFMETGLVDLANEICQFALDHGDEEGKPCAWAIASCGASHGYRSPGGEPSLAVGPIVDMGHFWPPCPVPDGIPGKDPRPPFAWSVSDPPDGVPVKDP